MIILGIDPGTASTGWGVIVAKHRRYELIAYGIITPKAGTLSEKYAIIFDGLCDIMDKYQPNAVSIETQFVYKNAASAIKIGMARGTALVAASKRSIPIFEYTPLRAKQAVTGSGKADKEDVKKMIRLLLSVNDNIPYDASDALSLAICHAHFADSPLAKNI